MPASKVYAFAEPENDGERQLIRLLQQNLSSHYRIYHTMERYAGGQTYEWDVVVLAPHAVYCLEVKDWPGHIVGNDRDWLLGNGAVRRNPCPLIAKKARILKNILVEGDAFFAKLWVEPLVVIADEHVQLSLKGDCSKATVTVKDLIQRITDPRAVQPERLDWKNRHDAIEKVLTANFKPAALTRDVAHFRLLEQLSATDLYTEWRAENRFAHSQAPVRLKIYAPDPYLTAPEREQQLQLVRRDFEAASRMGSHPNILGARDFFPTDGGRYVLVLDDLPGAPLSAELLSNHDLTFERKLRIVEDIAAGLAHAHTCKVIHRDLRPENVWLTPSGAVLVNFDCARVGNGKTIHENVESYLDRQYLAPEVRGSVAYASAASDIYAAGVILYELLTGKPVPENLEPDVKLPPGPSNFDALIDPKLNQLVLNMLAPEAAVRPSAEQLRDELATLLDQHSIGTPRPAESSSLALNTAIEIAVGSTIDGQYLMREEIGQGSFSKVYRVYSAVAGREYAMKVFQLEPAVGLQDVHKEFDILSKLLHPNIVRVWHAGLLRQEVHAYYLLTDYITGRSLQQLLETDPPTPARALDLTRDILHALQYLHSKEYIHRDIKPSNILVSPDGARLVDFNIAARVAGGREDGAGTPLYTPPDVLTSGAQPSRDLFALGVVLYQMMAGCHPYGGVPLPGKSPRDPLADQPRLTEAMARVLRRAIAPDMASRYVNAAEFLEDIANIEEPLSPAITKQSVKSGITISPSEQALPNYNPFLTRFLTLYSQNKTDNSGTRGYDEISEATYVRTRLDKRLAPDIMAGKYHLVVITGNAGDGKTAFLQSLEGMLINSSTGSPSAQVSRLPSGNGAEFDLYGCAYRTNYDGSQNEGGLQNDDVLAEFFAPFRGTAEDIASQTVNQARLIAINEGKLRDFLTRRESDFVWLSTEIRAHLDEGKQLPDGFLVVNLNDRSVVSSTADIPSIVDQQIQALCNPVFWAPCQACKYCDRCPVKFNVDTINHSDIGSRVRQRLERLFEIAHLRGRMHLTMRGVRSALTYILFGEASCLEIANILESSNLGPDQDEKLLDRFYYNAIAQSPRRTKPDETADQEMDRLLDLLIDADPGLGSNPADDRDLHFASFASPLLPRITSRATYDLELLKSWTERLGHELSDDPEDRSTRYRLQAALRRKAFFERPDDTWQAMLPYSLLATMRHCIANDDAATTELKTIILRGINNGEGLGDIDNFLVLRVARDVPGNVRSYRQFPISDFELRPARSATANEYVEGSPASLELAYHPRAGARHAGPVLRLSLDLIELLGRMSHGYAPTTAESRGPLVNLLVFRTLLAHEPYDQLLLVDSLQERRFHVEQRGNQVLLLE